MSQRSASARPRTGPANGGAPRRRRPLDRLRAVCLALPESTEREAWGTPTSRLRDKMFGM